MLRRPYHEGRYRIKEFLPGFGKRVFYARRNLGKDFSLDDTCCLELSERFGEGFWADALQRLLDLVEADFCVVLDCGDYAEGPLLAYDLDDAFARAGAEGAWVFVSHFHGG